MTLTAFASTRFGALEITPEAELVFPSGLIGVPGTRYTLLAREQDDAFLWLHSLEDPAFAMPVVNPWRFFADYELELSGGELERIGIADPADADVYVTVRAAEAFEDFTANLRAPILVAGGAGHQVLNEASCAVLRARLLDGIAVERPQQSAA